MPNHAAGSFAPVLKVLLELAHLGTAEFKKDFMAFCDKKKRPVGLRTVQAWLGEAVPEVGSKTSEPHSPRNNNLLNIVEYFRERLPCADFNDDFLKLEPAELRTRLEKLMSKKNESLSPLPFRPDPFQPGEIRNLCGTYILYRHALVKGRVMISCDVVKIEKDNGDNALAITMYCVPAKGATDGRPASPDEQEQFKGKLWKFNNLYFAMTLFEDLEQDFVRRVHTLQFPVLTTRPTTHYGLMGGYGAILGKPFSARIVLRKVPDQEASDEIRTKWVQPFQKEHPQVAAIAGLLSNALDEGQSVLTVDSGKLQSVDFPALDSAQNPSV